ncbi:MAG: basic amino acid ABC transporter substrate-binding protein [Cyanobacteria bacterium P01_G01_bin.4]
MGFAKTVSIAAGLAAGIGAAGIGVAGIGLLAPEAIAQVPDLGGAEITVGSDTAYPPFEFVDESGEIVGFDVDLLDAICERANCTSTFVTAGFDGIFAALAAGEYEAVASAVTITEERSEVVDFTRPYLNAGQIVTVAADSDIAGPDDLDGLSIGVQLGTTGDLEASNYTSEGSIQRYQTIDLAMAALAQGDIDAVIADAPTSADIVAKEFEGELLLVGSPFTTEYYGIAIQKETPEIAEAFNAAIAELAADGTLAEIAETWGIPAGSVTDLPESGLE